MALTFQGGNSCKVGEIPRSCWVRPSVATCMQIMPHRFVSNGSRFHCMQVVNPNTNRRFETLSYVPPLDPYQIAKQVDYIIRKGWVPCLEFDKRGEVFRENSKQSGYYDGRYWTMWKLPMFGCMDASAVLHEIEECKSSQPDAYIRVLAFDNKRKAQSMSFLVHRPSFSS